MTLSVLGKSCLFALLCLAALLILRPGWVADPFIRNDDYLFFFPAPDLAWFNTLTEGRWLNQLWAARGFHIPATQAYILCLALWCLTSALVAVRVLREQPGWAVLLTALALAAQPQHAQLMLWFNVLIPANLVLFCATLGLALAAPSWRHLWLALGTVGALHTYPTNALALWAIAVSVQVTDPPHGLRPCLLLALTFIAACLTGLAGIHVLNGLVHGHWGIEVAHWRGASPAETWHDLVRNVALLGGETRNTALLGAFVILLPILGLIMAAQPRRPDWLRALLLAGSLSVLAIIAQTLVSGTKLPNRATGFVWVLVVLGLALAWRHRAQGTALAALALACILGLAGWRVALAPELLAYQAQTRQIAAKIRAFKGTRTVLIRGQPNALRGMHILSEPLSLVFRLQHLTGAAVAHCTQQPLADASHPAEQPRIDLLRAAAARCTEQGDSIPPRQGQWALHQLASDTVLLRLPDTP